MKKRYNLALFFLLSGILFLILLSPGLLAQDEIPEVTSVGLDWETDIIAEGVTWKSYRGDDMFDARLSINLLEIDLELASIQYKIAHVSDKLIKTSELAEINGAIAAVNGSFFNMDIGGSVVFLKVDDEVIADGAVGRNPYTESGAIGWNEEGIPQILRKPEDGWHSVELSDVMSSGPLLIYQNEVRNFNNDSFNQNRHPRTAVAITDKNQLIMAVVDGRSFQSYGMTIPELTQFLQELGAVDALNLDGGGSTSMWVRDKKMDGIVNYPSDNFEFDHEGERGVSNALLLISN